MIGFLLVLDILIYNFTNYKTYCIILGILALKREEILKLICVSLIIDLFLFKGFLINTLILTTLFLINKYFFKIKKPSFYKYFTLNTFNLSFFIIMTYLINVKFDFFDFAMHLCFSLIINALIWLCSYNYLKRIIK